jgi:hypothetical protein
VSKNNKVEVTSVREYLVNQVPVFHELPKQTFRNWIDRGKAEMDYQGRVSTFEDYPELLEQVKEFMKTRCSCNIPVSLENSAMPEGPTPQTPSNPLFSCSLLFKF